MNELANTSEAVNSTTFFGINLSNSVYTIELTIIGNQHILKTTRITIVNLAKSKILFVFLFSRESVLLNVEFAVLALHDFGLSGILDIV